MGLQTNGRLEDYVLSKVESLQKDVECMFGILKGRFKYRDVKTCGQIYLTCAVLHNMMLSEMVREGKPPCLQRGVHLASNGIWIEGPSDSLPVPVTDDASRLREAFHQRQMQLCHHLRIWCDMNREKSKL
jgi:hypothetical protein